MPTSPTAPPASGAPRADADVPAYWRALGLPGLADIHIHFLPEPVLAKLEAACAATVKEPAFAESMKKQATDVRYMDRRQYAAWLKQNDELNKNLAKELGLSKR